MRESSIQSECQLKEGKKNRSRLKGYSLTLTVCFSCRKIQNFSNPFNPCGQSLWKEMTLLSRLHIKLCFKYKTIDKKPKTGNCIVCESFFTFSGFNLICLLCHFLQRIVSIYCISVFFKVHIHVCTFMQRTWV